jgi:hypothetical protein
MDVTDHLPGAAELGGDEAGRAGELGATFDHVAIAGRRIRDMLPLWRDTLGGGSSSAPTTQRSAGARSGSS